MFFLSTSVYFKQGIKNCVIYKYPFSDRSWIRCQELKTTASKINPVPTDLCVIACVLVPTGEQFYFRLWH